MSVVAIAVPLRDERDGLPLLVEALRRQHVEGWERLQVHLLFDGLDDADIPTVKRLAANEERDARIRFTTHVVPRNPSPNAGRARRMAVALALADKTSPMPQVVLTTDGDTVPASDWVANAVRSLDDVDVVAGHIARDATTILPSRDALEAYLEARHAMRRTVDPILYDPAPSHPWVGGANMGFRTSSYLALNGFPEVPSGEDKASVDKARWSGLRVRHARDVRVVTSSRLDGRIEGGLASALTHMASERSEPIVEHPEDAVRQYARHAHARRLRDGRASDADWRHLARCVGGTPDALRALAKTVPNGEAFAMQAVPVVATTRTLPLSQAHAALSDLDTGSFRGE